MNESLNAGLSFFQMGGYALYVWGSLGMCALLMAAEVMWLRSRRKALLRDMATPAKHGEHA